MIDVKRTVISQYDQAAALIGIITGSDAAIDPRADLDDFYNKVWNVATAVGWGLDVWGRIVGVSRYLIVPSDERYVGWAEADNGIEPRPQPFDSYGPWYNGQIINGAVALSDDDYRLLIMCKAAANITLGSIPNINRMLIILFGATGKVYVRHSGVMEMTYVFTYVPSAVESAIVLKSGALPRMAGVTVKLSVEP